MNKIFLSANNKIKGILLVVVGLILLLHTLGWIQRGLNIIIIIGSIAMILYGILLISNQNAVKNYINNMKGFITKK